MKASPVPMITPNAAFTRKLGEQVARQPPRRVVHRDRGAVQVGRAEQPDHPIPQVLALQQNEDRDDQHDGSCGQRFDNRRDDALRKLDCRQVRLMHLHRDRLLRVGGWCRGRGGSRFGFGGDDDMSRLADEAAREIRHAGQHELLHRIDLLLDRERVARHLLGQSGHLRADQAAECQDHREGEQHGKQHRRDPAEMHSPQQVDERREQEGQQHRERDRNQHRAAEVKPGDHDDRDGDGQQAAQSGGFSRRDLGRASVQRVGQIRHQIWSFCAVSHASLSGEVRLIWSCRYLPTFRRWVAGVRAETRR